MYGLKCDYEPPLVYAALYQLLKCIELLKRIKHLSTTVVDERFNDDHNVNELNDIKNQPIYKINTQKMMVTIFILMYFI